MNFKNIPITFIALILGIYVLKVSENILVPLVISIFLWYIISAIASGYRKIIPNKYYLNVLIATFSLVLIVWIPITIINANIPKIISGTDLYQENLHNLILKILDYFNIEKTIFFEKTISALNFKKIIPNVINSITNIASNLFIIIVYVIFLFIEQKSFDSKFHNIFRNKEMAQKANDIITKISQKIQSYLLIKTATSFITAFLCFLVMKLLNLDFAIFWSVLIFFLNYIPNVGSVIGTFFPVLAAIVQFSEITPVVSISIGLISIQFIIGNFLEPKAMGSSLNLSPFAIIFSLIFWKNIWGFTGMYLSVPITVITMIITAEFSSTRWIATLLSENGNINES